MRRLRDMENQEKQIHVFTISKEDEGSRLDQFITQQLPTYSRSFFKRLLHAKCVTLNGKPVHKAGTSLKVDDEICVTFPSFKPKIPARKPPVDVEVLYEDSDFMIINKPAGLIVHEPHPLSNETTLVDWLLYHRNSIREIGPENRPGIVHRLDKDTSGIMIIPLTSRAHAKFGELFKERKIHKRYHALVEGHPDQEGTIDLSIYRHPIHKHKMTADNKISSYQKRDALTHYRILKYFKDSALIEARPITGRTHQVRVHAAAIGHPLIGDVVYGKPNKLIKRQALHAQSIDFVFNGEQFNFSCSAPDDFRNLVKQQEELKL